MVAGKANLTYADQSIELDVLEGTEQERAVDITPLRSQTGMITLDPGFANTGATQSAITFIDGDQGILRYRGYPIEELAAKSNFVEVSYLLIYGHLPTASELVDFRNQLTHHSMIHEDMLRVIDAYPSSVHPMAFLSSMACALSSFYPETLDVKQSEYLDVTMIRLLAKLPTIAACCYKKFVGQPYNYPDNKLDYAANLLQMMYRVPSEEYYVDPDAAQAMDLMFILHADHEQNCSTSAVRVVGSAETNLYASIAAGICALWGPLHGGANEAVVNMLSDIHHSGEPLSKWVDRAKDKTNQFRLMGFGHRVYKNLDPRAAIIREAADRILGKMKRKDPLLDIARQLEEVALKDEYFIERKLYPNVDFYSGVIYRALNIPVNMFTVMFALGRLPGWIAHWKENLEAQGRRIARPRQIYIGHVSRPYVPMGQRS